MFYKVHYVGSEIDVALVRVSTFPSLEYNNCTHGIECLKDTAVQILILFSILERIGSSSRLRTGRTCELVQVRTLEVHAHGERVGHSSFLLARE